MKLTVKRLEEIKGGELPTGVECWEMAVVCIANHPDTVEQPEQEETNENK